MIEVIYSAGHGGADTEGDLLVVDSQHATQAEATKRCARLWAQGFEAYTREVTA